MAGISSRAAGSLESRIKFNGKELNEDLDLDWYEYGFRNNFDPQLGRFHSVDPLASDYPFYTPYQFAGNQPTIAVDLDGLEPFYVNEIMQWASEKVVTNPNSSASKAIGAAIGMGKSIEKTITGAINAVRHPIETAQGLLEMSTFQGQLKASYGIAEKLDVLQSGSGFDKAVVVGEAVTDAVVAVAGTKGASAAGLKGSTAVGEVAGVANPIPGQVARVIQNSIGEVTTLGSAGSVDVFVTASSDIKGLNAAQIAQRLTIPESSTGFKLITFETPQGIASPINRNNPGFIGEGRTAGGAREFVIPNQTIPKNAKIKTVN